MSRTLAVCAIVVLAVVAGCSAGDDCQKASAKLRPVVEERARLHGELSANATLSELDKDHEVQKLAEKCRATRKAHPEDPMTMTHCVLDAVDDATVRACVASALGD